MPRGRVGYGDISSYDMEEMRRRLIYEDPESLEVPGIEHHEDTSHWTPRELAFSERLRELSLDDLKLYIDIQPESNPDLSCNQVAINRMIPRPTQYELNQLGQRRVQEIRSSTEELHRMPRDVRREFAKRKFVIPSSFDTKATPIQMTPIQEQEEAPYTFTTYPADPEYHNLIPTNRRRQKKRAEQAQKLKDEQAKKKAEEEGKDEGSESDNE